MSDAKYAAKPVLTGKIGFLPTGAEPVFSLSFAFYFLSLYS